MELQKLFEFSAAVLYLRGLDNGMIGAIDAESSIRIIDSLHHRAIKAIRIGIIHESYHQGRSALGPKGEVCACINDAKKSVGVFGINEKKCLFEIDRHEGRIETVVLDDGLRYLFSGGQDGRIYVWNLKEGKLLESLQPHKDFITAMAFDPKHGVLASGSFDRYVHINFLDDKRKPIRMAGHTTAVVSLAFLDDEALISADKSGELICWEWRCGTAKLRYKPMPDEVRSIVISYDRRLVFAGTALGYVGVYDAQSGELIDAEYIKVKGSVCSMVCTEQELWIGTAADELHVYRLYGDEALYSSWLDRELYQKYYAEVSRNPLLKYRDLYRQAEQAWNEACLMAREELLHGHAIQAARRVNPFKKIPSKIRTIEAMMRMHEASETFSDHVENRRYHLAYQLAAQYPELRETELFIEMETEWERCFSEAYKLLSLRTGEDEARRVLAPFRGISEKTALIQEMFKERKRYHLFVQFLQKKQWKQAFELTRNYPFLKEFKSYRKLLAQADNIYIQATKAYEKGNMAKAEQLYTILLDFPDFKDDAKEMIHAIHG